jgi:hypothetical protein
MTSNASTAEIHELLEPFRAHYEICPYYVVSERRPVGGQLVEQRVQAGFDVNLYGAVGSMRLPLFHTEAAQKLVDFFESAAKEIESSAGQSCTVRVIPYTDSLVVQPQQQFSAEGMLQIRISHGRGVDQPEGPAEELALKATQALLQELGIKRR